MVGTLGFNLTRRLSPGEHYVVKKGWGGDLGFKLKYKES